MASLYEISAGYASLVDAYDQADTEEEREAILGLLAQAEGDLADKSENYARLIRMKEEEAKAFKSEIDRLTVRKQAAENMVKRLKNTMLEAMKMTDTPKIETSIGKWRLQPNPMSCNVTDPDKVPERFHIAQPDRIDKAAMIREHKATGELFDGAEFKQELGVRFQ